MKNMKIKEKLDGLVIRLKYCALKQDDGIDGILVTVGLCIIALVLCVVMKDSLKVFIQDLVTAMTKQAKSILAGTK